MRKYTKKEIEDWSREYFDEDVIMHGLYNAKRIHKALGKLLKVETQRRKELGD